MNYWRLITHHEPRMKGHALAICHRNSLILLGWGAIGDLRAWQPTTRGQIRDAILNIPGFANPQNASNGGTSLWNLYQLMDIGDRVMLVTDRGPRAVVEVVGEYEWRDDYQGVQTLPDYHHCRAVQWTDEDPEGVSGKLRLPPGMNRYCALLPLV